MRRRFRSLFTRASSRASLFYTSARLSAPAEPLVRCRTSPPSFRFRLRPVLTFLLFPFRPTPRGALLGATLPLLLSADPFSSSGHPLVDVFATPSKICTLGCSGRALAHPSPLPRRQTTLLIGRHLLRKVVFYRDICCAKSDRFVLNHDLAHKASVAH